ncbi:hypothetical protein OIU77_000911 [Salix suchowensis]|uniref:NB-ARC domain-containing protein n=1 Tax=Salix suchowensis TaxID=1278906 RepID=A0ABQ9BAW9_9ROSI|nr:hypothetical protein OIU77_000911 [Salix suchowensis]
MGKTTLAKLVCNDERVVKHFQSSIWVHVSRDFDMRLLVEKIVNSATGGGGVGEDYGKMEMDELQEVLRESLEDKKFLLVLDDLWNENPAKWDELKDFLRAGAGGSMILGTTRGNRVASMVGTMPTYNLPGLPHDDCLALFVNYAFQKEQEKQYPNLLKIGEEIVRKCGGVPLAVRTLAGQLFSNTDEQEWVRIKDTELWKTEQKGNDILPALRVSYEQLPSDLKRCFAYCSLFPKNYEFNDYELTQFWMAHGLLRSSNGCSQLEEDIGFGYLKELEYGCFLQDFRDQYGSLQFKMHDVMHDLALSVAQESKGCQTPFASYRTCKLFYLVGAMRLKICPEDLHISGCENFNFGYQAPCEFRLRKLVLCCLIVVEDLPEWLIKGSAETLKNLNVEFCPVLVDLPDCLQNFSALQEIWILGCPLLGGNANKTAMIGTRLLLSRKLLSTMLTLKQHKLRDSSRKSCLDCMHESCSNSRIRRHGRRLLDRTGLRMFSSRS